jgi:maltooligosyltrehalose trehalohydrolase
VLQVWAPKAREVEVESGGHLRGMTRTKRGWWTLDAPCVEHGVDYAFRINGDGPFPDPRSPYQPKGVHGPSHWVDHSLYTWNDANWQPPSLASAIVYELHVGTFTPKGTFTSAGRRLDHLVDLGVTHVELMPVAEYSGNRGWGYDGVDLYAPHHAYGGPEELKDLVAACHQRGLAVLLDVVYNHLGPTGNYLGRFGPYFSHRFVTPWGESINFDGPESDEVRRFFIDNALMWLRDYHFDGLRIDAVHAIFDTSALHILEQLADEVGQLGANLGRRLVLIAESDLNDPRVVRSPSLGGYGIDAQWNEDFHHAVHAALTGERNGYYADFGRLADVAKVLTQGFAYDGRYSAYRRRSHGRPATGLSGHNFVGCLQNHDQVGNRALGERISQLLSPNQLKIGAALVMTAPFVPMLFQGEEWAASTPFLYFTDHRDLELGEAVRRGRREEFAAFGWKPAEIPDPQAEATFLRSKLLWHELAEAPHSELLEWYRSLIRLRRESPILRDGSMKSTLVDFDETARWLKVERGPFSVICNLADSERRVPCPGLSQKRPVLSSREGFFMDGEALVLPEETVVLLQAD